MMRSGCVAKLRPGEAASAAAVVRKRLRENMPAEPQPLRTGGRRSVAGVQLSNCFI
jgi:hypothetical protein